MPVNAECPLCRLRRIAGDFVKAQNVEEACSCAKAPLAVMALPMRVGCGILAAGAFFIARGLYEAKFFVQLSCPFAADRPAGQDTERHS
jgi:hypothetical protein